MANKLLENAGRPGSIVLVADSIDSNQNEILAQQKKFPVHILAVAGEQSKPLPLDSPPAPAIDVEALNAGARAAGATLTIITPDDSDVKKLSRNITSSFAAAVNEEGDDRWRDFGYWLTPLITLGTLYWFRRGWMV